MRWSHARWLSTCAWVLHGCIVASFEGAWHGLSLRQVFLQVALVFLELTSIWILVEDFLDLLDVGIHLGTGDHLTVGGHLGLH